MKASKGSPGQRVQTEVQRLALGRNDEALFVAWRLRLEANPLLLVCYQVF